MFKWLKLYIKANPQTKTFVLINVLFGSALILSAIYCYARLDFVRSYKTAPAAAQSNVNNK